MEIFCFSDSVKFNSNCSCLFFYIFINVCIPHLFSFKLMNFYYYCDICHDCCCFVQLFKVRDDFCLFCCYLWNCWLSLLKRSFHINNKTESILLWQNLYITYFIDILCISIESMTTVTYMYYKGPPMQSVPITIDVVSLNLDQGEVYNIMW